MINMKKYNIKLSSKDLNIIFNFLRKGIWEEVNDTIQSIHSQKIKQDSKKVTSIKKTKEKQ